MKVTIAHIRKLKEEGIDLLHMTSDQFTDIDNVVKIVNVCTGSAAAADEFMQQHGFGEVIAIITESMQLSKPQPPAA
jgi:hypothetical protein